MLEVRTFFLLYIINIISALIGLILLFIFIKKGNSKLFIIPKNLRLFIITSFLSCGIIQAIMTIIFSTHYLFYRDEDDIIFKSLRLLQSISSQHLRGSLFVTVIERIVSTMFLEKYNTHTKDLRLFWILTFITSCFTLLYAALSVEWIFDSYYIVYVYIVAIATITHLSTLVVAKILHSQNQKMYKLLAYRVTLKKRYQIFENIKVIKILWSTIALFTLIAPIGVLAALIYNIIAQEPAPSGLFFVTYNPSFIIILLTHLKKEFKSGKVSSKKDYSVQVISALGKRLPTSNSTDVYFQELQRQWN